MSIVPTPSPFTIGNAPSQYVPLTATSIEQRFAAPVHVASTVASAASFGAHRPMLPTAPVDASSVSCAPLRDLRRAARDTRVTMLPRA